MALTDLSTGDFDFYKRKAYAMKDTHAKEFLNVIDPELMRALYRGRDSKTYEGSDKMGFYNDKTHFMAMSKIFQGVNTILPNLYYQNPKPIVLPMRDSDDDSAALMSAILTHYRKPQQNNAKKQNQKSVLDAVFFGIGWKKIGYRTVFMPKVDEPETRLDMNILQKMGSLVGMGPKPDNSPSKERPDIVDYETLYNDSESPSNIAVDEKADLDNCKAILHMLPRTLHDLQISGDYDEALMKELSDVMRHKNGSRMDAREINLKLNEMHIWQRNGIWILAWVEEFGKALFYEKSSFDGRGFLFEPLVLTNEPGVRYPVSFLKVASQQQIKLNDLASLYVEQVARATNMLAINEQALAPGQAAALEQNLVRGILKLKRPLTPGELTQIVSTSVSNDIPNLMGLIQQNITEVLGADPQLVSGHSENDTLGQDELARVGTKVRESGALDRVRDWEISQLTKEGILIKQFSKAELHVKITGKDYANPMTGECVEDKWMSFMTPENPMGAKELLQGDFDYDIDIEEAVKPNKENQRKALTELLTVAINPQFDQALLPKMRFRKDLLVRKLVGTYEALGNPDMFLEKLDARQAAAIQAMNALTQGGGQVPGAVQPIDIMKEKSKLNDQEVTQKSSKAANL